MKSTLLFGLTPLLLAACVSLTPSSQQTNRSNARSETMTFAPDNTPALTEYTFVAVSPIWLYGADKETRYRDIPVGDTIFYTGPRRTNAFVVALYKSTPVWIYGLDMGATVQNTRFLNRLEKDAYKMPIVQPYGEKFQLPEKSKVEVVEAARPAAIEAAPSSVVAAKPEVNRSTTRTYKATATRTSSESTTIYTGPRGGRYYYNSSGKKTYVKSGSSSGGSYRRRSSSRSYSRRR